MEQQKPEVFRQYATLLVATIAMLNFGAMLTYSSPAGALLSRNETSDIVLTYREVGWLVSYLELGAFFGSLVGAVGLRKVGRRGVMLAGGVAGFIGWALITFAQDKFMLMFGRFVCGILGGMSTLAESAYTAEIASPEIRGKIGTMCPLMGGFGIALLAIVTWFSNSWRILAAVFMIISLLQCILMYFNYETPTYLLMTGKEVEAKETLQKLRGRAYDISSELAEMKRLAERTKERLSTPLPWKKLKRPEVYKPLAICLTFSCIMAFMGTVPFTSNLELILQSTGASLDKFLGVSTFGYGVMGMISSVLLIFLNDRVGRKTVIVGTGTVTGSSFVLFGLYFAVRPSVDEQSISIQLLGRVPFFTILFFIPMYRNTSYLYNAELLTPDVREVCGLIIYAVFCAANILASVTFFPLQELFPKYVTYWIYGGWALSGVLFTLLFLPETSGRSVETINLYFHKNSGKRKNVNSPVSNDNISTLTTAAECIVDLLPEKS